MTDFSPTNPFFSREELLSVGFTSVGRDTQVSRRASLIGVSGTLGDFTRVDDFVVLKGTMNLGRAVHISSFCIIAGSSAPVTIGDLVAIGAYTAVYGSSDNYRSDLLTGPLARRDLVDPIVGPVRIERGALVGAHCVVLPNSVVGEFATIGAHCIVSRPIRAGEMVVTASGRPNVAGRRDVAKLRELADQGMPC